MPNGCLSLFSIFQIHIYKPGLCTIRSGRVHVEINVHADYSYQYQLRELSNEVFSWDRS